MNASLNMIVEAQEKFEDGEQEYFISGNSRMDPCLQV